MTRRDRHKPVSVQLRSLYLWHRWIGLVSAVFVIILAVTGLVLNHTEEMALDSRHVQSPALLDWYGIRAPEISSSYQAGPLTLSAIGRQVFVNSGLLPNIEPPLVGAVRYDDFVIAALHDRLVVLTLNGELVEQLDRSAGLPPAIRAIGIGSDQRPVIDSSTGRLMSDGQLLTWTAATDDAVTWSEPVAATAELVAAIQRRYRGEGLPLERILLDLHSGRILGQWGVYLMDAAAIIFLLLAISGIWLWGKRRASARAHRRRINGRAHSPDADSSVTPTAAAQQQQHEQAQQ